MTPFRKKVLAIVSSIPKGSVMTYKAVAADAGVSGAYRAVGTIMAYNFDPSVPCHRVVRSDGVLGGYNRGGSDRKKRLLESEGVCIVTKSGRYIVKLFL